jgi:hypothetical protein
MRDGGMAVWMRADKRLQECYFVVCADLWRYRRRVTAILKKDKEHGTLLHRVKRACSISYVTLRVLLIVIIAAWSLVALFALLGLMSPPAFGWIDVLGMPVLLNFLIISSSLD